MNYSNKMLCTGFLDDKLNGHFILTRSAMEVLRDYLSSLYEIVTVGDVSNAEDNEKLSFLSSVCSKLNAVLRGGCPFQYVNDMSDTVKSAVNSFENVM